MKYAVEMKRKQLLVNGAVNTSLQRRISMQQQRTRCFLCGLRQKYMRTVAITQIVARVEAGSNTSTVTLRVVRGDEKGTQCLGVQLRQPVPGGYKYEDPGPSTLGESQI
jgi:ribosomal protein S14